MDAPTKPIQMEAMSAKSAETAAVEPVSLGQPYKTDNQCCRVVNNTQYTVVIRRHDRPVHHCIKG